MTVTADSGPHRCRSIRDVEIRDVRLRLAVEKPLGSEFRTTVIPSLQPEETEQLDDSGGEDIL